MDLNLNTNISLFPTPPKHYKQFTKEDSLPPPDLNLLTKVTSFMTFGKEYKTNERNTSSPPVDTSFMRYFDQKLIQSKNVPNKNIFQDPNIKLDNLVIESLNIDIFDAIEEEIKFMKRIYKEMLSQITQMEDFELSSCLIKFSFQKVYFFISLLKKKKIFIDIIQYFKKEKDVKTNLLENVFPSNLKECQELLEKGMKDVLDEKKIKY